MAVDNNSRSGFLSGPKLRIGGDETDLGIVYPTKLMVGVERDITIAGKMLYFIPKLFLLSSVLLFSILCLLH